MSNAIVDKYQSTYLPHRSTEIALTFIINDILIYLGNKAPFYLVLLNLSSAFDTLDYILSIGLNAISIHGQIHSWFMYFVSSRTSSVKINSSLSPPYFNIERCSTMLCPWTYIVHYLYSLYSYKINFFYQISQY